MEQRWGGCNATAYRPLHLNSCSSDLLFGMMSLPGEDWDALPGHNETLSSRLMVCTRVFRFESCQSCVSFGCATGSSLKLHQQSLVWPAVILRETILFTKSLAPEVWTVEE